MTRGTLLHELLHLPGYLNTVRGISRAAYPVEKIAYGTHRRQYCLCTWPTAAPPKAWVIYWHGGGWQFGSPEQFQATSLPWLRAGYGVILPSYRRLPFHDLTAIRADLIASLVACRKWWTEQGYTPRPKVILQGLSAGGHLAAVVGLDHQLQSQAAWQPNQVIGVIACAPVLDLATMENNPIIRLLAGQPGTTIHHQANPMALIRPDSMPLFLLHGTADGLVPYQGSVNFAEKYQLVNSAAACEFVTLPNGTHLEAGHWMYTGGELQARILARGEAWLTAAQVAIPGAKFQYP